jgi:hypothetical protein
MDSTGSKPDIDAFCSKAYAILESEEESDDESKLNELLEETKRLTQTPEIGAAIFIDFEGVYGNKPSNHAGAGRIIAELHHYLGSAILERHGSLHEAIDHERVRIN